MYNSLNQNKNVVSQIFGEHLFFRKQIFKLAIANIQKTYHGAALGWAWALIQPCFTIFVYWFAFTIGLRGSRPVINVYGEEFSYFLWLVAGIIPWFYLRELLNTGTNCIRSYSYLVTKMSFPVSTIPTFFSLSKVIVNSFLQVLCILLFCLAGHPPDIYFLQLPYYILMLFIYGTGQTLLFSLLSIMSKDFSNLVRSFTMAIFWLSGIIWNVDNVKVEWLKPILNINPVTYLCNGFRNVYINKIWFFDQKRTFYFLIVTLIIYTLAFLVYRKIRKDIPDVL